MPVLPDEPVGLWKFAFGVKFCGTALTQCTCRIWHWNLLRPTFVCGHGQHMMEDMEVIRQTVPLLLGALGTARARHANPDGGEHTDGVTVAWEQGLAISQAQLKQQVLWPRAETLHPPPPLSLTLSFSLCFFDLRPSIFSLSCISPPALYVHIMEYQAQTVPLISLSLSHTLSSFLLFSCMTAVNGHLCKRSPAQCSETHG